MMGNKEWIEEIAIDGRWFIIKRFENIYDTLHLLLFIAQKNFEITQFRIIGN
jgi:hypothetical protein|tara:strand:+ start:362 stop:517 length:156 start_codon:yes stop_codon:yes gene_type:complete